MKVLASAQMREVDRLTIERGIPGIVLMENAGNRVVEFLVRQFQLKSAHVAVICGKGNNGGDGFVVARQLFSRGLCRNLEVFEIFDRASLTGDAAQARQMLETCGCPVQHGMPRENSLATIAVDAVLGAGITGPARGEALDAIQAINTRFPQASKVAVDIPSGLLSDSATAEGDYVRAGHTITFTALKPIHALSRLCGDVVLEHIGSPSGLLDSATLNLIDPSDLSHLFAPRPMNSNKGMYGHVLVVGGSFGKSGAPAMSGIAAYRAGAGLVTVAIPESVLTTVASYRPELMTEPTHDLNRLKQLCEKMTVLAIGPGLGTTQNVTKLVTTLYTDAEIPAVVDADALNVLAGNLPQTDRVRVLTPHPGEMGRLIGKSTKEVQEDRVGNAVKLAEHSGATVVLKGDRTVIAFPDGETWINPTGCPAMATGGTGDVLTGMISGLIAQHPRDWKNAVLAAVYLHGRIGELAAIKWGEQAMLATDMLEFLPEAMDELRPSH